jgi:hypothetical protein
MIYRGIQTFRAPPTRNIRNRTEWMQQLQSNDPFEEVSEIAVTRNVPGSTDETFVQSPVHLHVSHLPPHIHEATQLVALSDLVEEYVNKIIHFLSDQLLHSHHPQQRNVEVCRMHLP